MAARTDIGQFQKYTTREKVVKYGGAKVVGQGLGEMPLTLFVIVAGVVLYFYIRRARLGIDKHPGETVKLQPRSQGGKPPVLPFVSLSPSGGGGPIQ